MKSDFQKKGKRNPPPQSKAHKSTLMPLVSSSSNEPMSKASAALTSPRGGIKGGGYWKSQRRRVRLPGDQALGPACYPIKNLPWKMSRCQSVWHSFKLTQSQYMVHNSPQRRCTLHDPVARGWMPATGQERVSHTHKCPKADAGRTRAQTLRLNRRD